MQRAASVMKRSSTPKSLKQISKQAIYRIRFSNLTVAQVEEAIASLTPFQLKLFNQLAHMSNYFAYNFQTLVYMAEKVGCCRQTVIRAIQQFEFLGLVMVKRRKKSAKKNYPNVYFLHGLFKKPETRWLVGRMIPAFMGIAMAFLFSGPLEGCSNRYFYRNVTPIRVNRYKYIRNELQCPLILDFTDETNSPPDSEAVNLEEKVMLRRESESPLTRAKQKIVQFLNPTPRARIEAELYSTQTLGYAARRIKYQFAEGNDIYDPFLLLFKYCEDYSRKNNIVIDRENVDHLKQVYQPKGPWSISAPDVERIKFEVSVLKKQKEGQCVQRSYGKKTAQPAGEPGPSTTELLRVAKLAAPETKEVLPDTREEIATAVAQTLNSDGSYSNPFMAILAQGIMDKAN